MNKMSKSLPRWITSALILALLTGSALLISSCGDTGTKGDVKHTWVINALVVRDATTNLITAYVEISKDKSAFQSSRNAFAAAAAAPNVPLVAVECQ